MGVDSSFAAVNLWGADEQEHVGAWYDYRKISTNFKFQFSQRVFAVQDGADFVADAAFCSFTRL